VDQTALIVGGGAKIPIGARFVLTGAARNYLAAAGGRTQDVRDASQLRSNWQYSLGLSFGIGGRGNRRRAVASARRDTVFVERRGGRVVEVDEGRLVRDGESVPAAERVTVVERYAVTARGDTLRGAGVDSALTADRTTRLVEVRRVDDRPTASVREPTATPPTAPSRCRCPPRARSSSATARSARRRRPSCRATRCRARGSCRRPARPPRCARSSASTASAAGG
jgi:hypothetical protein